MKVFRTVSFSFLLMTAAFAVQQTRPGQPDQPPGAQTNPANPQGQPAQTQPPDTRAPQTSPQGQSPQTPTAPQAAQPPSIDEQVAVLTQELNLTSDQQAKVKTILTDQRQQAMTVVGDQNLSRADKIDKIHTIRESTIGKVRNSLNDDQKKKLDQMLQGQGQQSPSGTSPSNAPPTHTPPK